MGMPAQTESSSMGSRPVRDWSAYNDAEIHEREFFSEMAHLLVQIVEEPTYSGRGRPPTSLRQIMLDCLEKVYISVPSRDLQSEFNYHRRKGLRDQHVPHFNTTSKYMRDHRITEYLYQMLKMTAYPLRDMEPVVAVDSSGFIARPPGQWNDVKHGRDNEDEKTRRKRRRKLRRGVKGHIISGVKSNIIIAASVTHIEASDHAQLLGLLDQTLGYYRVEELSGDKAYMSHMHFELLGDLDILPFIAFRDDVKVPPLDDLWWSRMYHLAYAHEDIWNMHYYLRNNVESTIGMVKAHFGEKIMAVHPVGQTNEGLIKFICHNIRVLNHQTAIMGIDPFDLGVTLPRPHGPQTSNGRNGNNGTNGRPSLTELYDLHGLPRLSETSLSTPCFCPACRGQGPTTSPFSNN